MLTNPVCPPASVPCATTRSTPAASASRAAATVLTWVATRMPAACARSTYGAGAPNDNASRNGRAARAASNSSGRRSSAQIISPMPKRLSSSPRATAASACRYSIDVSLEIPSWPSEPALVIARVSFPSVAPTIGAPTIG